ncbi:MAG: hypothetical protein GXP62_10545 [Oligoflexia bacterium]|nr:hypothetical protein [Oligoflexia bacterium]
MNHDPMGTQSQASEETPGSESAVHQGVGRTGRRATPRVAFEALVSLSSETCFVTGDAENISQGGIYVATLSPPPEGEIVTVRIRVDEDSCPPLPVTGRVAWVRRDELGEALGCGISFTDVDGVTEAGLHAMIDRVDREPLMWEF